MRLPANLGFGKSPHALIRPLLMQAAMNSFGSASGVYRSVESREQSALHIKRSQRLLDELRIFLAAMEPIDGAGVAAISDAKSLEFSLTAYLAHENGRQIYQSGTGDWLSSTFVWAMRRLWIDITGRAIGRPHNRLLVDLAVGVWLDASMPNGDDGDLHGRIKKWFDRK